MSKDKTSRKKGSGIFKEKAEVDNKVPAIPPEEKGQAEVIPSEDVPVQEEVVPASQSGLVGVGRIKELELEVEKLELTLGGMKVLIKESGEKIQAQNLIIANLETDQQSAPDPEAVKIGRAKPASELKQAISKLYTSQGLEACMSVFKAAGCEAKNVNEVPEALRPKALKLALVALDG